MEQDSTDNLTVIRLCKRSFLSASAWHKVLSKAILHSPSESVKLKHTQSSVHGPMWNQAWSLVSKVIVMAILMYRKRFAETPSITHMVQITPFYAFCAILVNSAQPAFPLKFNRWPRLFLWLRTRWSRWLEFKGHIVGMGVTSTCIYSSGFSVAEHIVEFKQLKCLCTVTPL